jgi:hypothetical protein
MQYPQKEENHYDDHGNGLKPAIIVDCNRNIGSLTTVTEWLLDSYAMMLQQK